MDHFVRESKRGVVLAVHVVPRSARSEITGVHGQALKIRLTAPPVQGAANKALVALLAKTLGIAKGRIQIISGQTSRDKTLVVSGLSREAIADRIGRSLPKAQKRLP